jgi:hypothetical protein
MVIQLLNAYYLDEISRMPPFAIFSISLSVLSLSNTMWYYAYWNLFRCKPIRDVPSSLSLYNYKLSGVKDGKFSFGKTSHDVNEFELSQKDNMLSVTIGDTVLNDDYKPSGLNSGEDDFVLPKKAGSAGGLEIEFVRPCQDAPEAEAVVDEDVAPAPVSSLISSPFESGSAFEILNDGAGIDDTANRNENFPSLELLQSQLIAARSMISKLKNEKLSMSQEIERMKEQLLQLSTSTRDCVAMIVPGTNDVPNRHDVVTRYAADDPFEMV